MIPLHSIYLSRHSSPPLGWRIEQNIASFKNAHENSPHTLYGMESGRRFIADHFDQSVQNAFDELVPLAYKADLLRYCILYKRGGLYADLSVNFFFPIPVADKSKMFVFRDGFNEAPWIVSNTIIYSPPANPVFRACIEQIVENVANQYYGVTALCPTGPNLFGRMIARHMDLEDLTCGEAVRVNKTASHSFIYLDQSGEAIASAIKRGPGLASLGAGAEDYNDYYARREIYKGAAGKKVWRLAELAHKGYVKQIEPSASHTEIVIYGPYTTLDAGSYRASFLLDAQSNDLAGGPKLKMDVCAEYGQRIISAATVAPRSYDENRISLSTVFRLHETSKNVEIRLHSSRPVSTSKGALVIERCD